MTALVPERSSAPLRLLQYSRWDWVPVVLGLLHFIFVVALFVAFPHLTWAEFVPLALLYSISISWSINSVSHNFIHNPYFKSWALNTAFSFILSLTIGFSQKMYDFVHMRHHSGNMDRPDEYGNTVDYISIYKHGHDRQPENVWTYTFLSYFRDDPKEFLCAMRRPADVLQSKIELVCLMLYCVGLAALDWRFVICMVPFNYLGQCLSSLNGYYEHFGGNPDRPIAWGVSAYGKLYNWTWMNNGYHAEHHFRPKIHWTKMAELHREIADQQKRAGTRVIRPPHALGFLDPYLPKR